MENNKKEYIICSGYKDCPHPTCCGKTLEYKQLWNGWDEPCIAYHTQDINVKSITFTSPLLYQIWRNTHGK